MWPGSGLSQQTDILQTFYTELLHLGLSLPLYSEMVLSWPGTHPVAQARLGLGMLCLSLPGAGTKGLCPGPAKPLSLKLNIVQVLCLKEKRHYSLDYILFHMSQPLPETLSSQQIKDIIILGSFLKPTLI